MAKTIKLTADVFVIPNTMTKIKSAMLESYRERDRKLVYKLLEVNGYKCMDLFTPDIIDDFYMVQLWWCSTTPDVPSDNIARHGITIDGKHYIPNIEYLPALIFKKKKEGETFFLKVPCEDAAEDTVFEFEVTPRQLEYRYKSFGKFEEAFEKVIPADIDADRLAELGRAATGLSPIITKTEKDKGFDNTPYSPRDLINYYEEVMKETVLNLSRVQEKAEQTLNEITLMKIDALEIEDRNNLEYLVREISAMLDTVKASTNCKIKTAIGKRAECDKYTNFCINHWGGEK